MLVGRLGRSSVTDSSRQGIQRPRMSTSRTLPLIAELVSSRINNDNVFDDLFVDEVTASIFR